MPKSKQVPRKVVKMNLSLRESQGNIPSILPEIDMCQETIPIPMEILPMKERSKKHTISSDYTARSWESNPSNRNRGILSCINKEGELVYLKAYKKIMPLITPYRWMKYKERPNEPFGWGFQKNHLVSYANQAYVDTMASSLVSKIHKEHGVPHFCEFYGAYRGRADVYLYNLEDEFDDFRFSHWFWDELEKDTIGLRVIEKETGRQLTFEECKALMKPDESHLYDDSSDDDDNGNDDSDDDDDDIDDDDDSGDSENSDATGEEGIEELTMPLETGGGAICSDLKSVGSLSTCEDAPLNLCKKKGYRSRTVSTVSSDISDAFEDEYFIYAELRNMPVVVMFLEEMDGTMDDILECIENKETSVAEHQWTAWIFQICAALVVLQDYLQLTHNDLHTNNILWKETSEEFLYYKDTYGRVWKVPTFGKLFHIIDYGRAVFSLNNHIIISSDYHDGNDAAGQYNFGSFQDKSKPHIGPNKSFDLSRLACSLMRILFPRNPPYKKNGAIMTQDGETKVYETENHLFNILWGWLKNTRGSSVLEDESGNEKYPGFDLYIHIAQYVKNAVPSEQINNPLFANFLMNQVPKELKSFITLPL